MSPVSAVSLSATFRPGGRIDARFYAETCPLGNRSSTTLANLTGKLGRLLVVRWPRFKGCGKRRKEREESGNQALKKRARRLERLTFADAAGNLAALENASA